MGRRFVHWKGPVAATLILVLFIAAASFIVTGRINEAEEAVSFTRLAEEAEEFAHSLELNVDSDREKLGLIAEMMASDLNGLEEFLHSYRSTGTFFSRLELLLPGDEVVTSDGTHVNVSEQLSFEREAALGAHISDRQLDLNGEDYVVRHFVPVKSENETIAMLYGVIELGDLARKLPYSPYGGEAAVYVIDGTTGDFLIDTWHDEMGNIWDLGERPMAEGYDHERLRQGLVDGESNYVVFLSNTTGENLYFYYTPLGINQWRVALSVPETLVFAGARDIRQMLNFFLVIEGLFFLVYISWLVFYVRRETGEKQRQLDALNYIYDVEKLLFNAHEHRENIIRSLEVIAQMLPAKRVAFTMMGGDGPSLDYLWEVGGESILGRTLVEKAQVLADRFTSGHGDISVHTPQEVRAILPDAPEKMGDLVAIPVEDADGTLQGIISAGGLSKQTGCATMLRSVGFSFAMLCGNMRTYQEMQRQGERDTLTGLYNRNRYELDLPRIAAECREGICCAFIDANGLHEMNNDRGHEAGDDMLRAIAEEIRNRFDSKHAYRLGGDEFVIFAVDEVEPKIIHHSRTMTIALEQKGYHISVGVAWISAPVKDLEALVKAAEKRMYKAKQKYYSNPDHDRRARR